MTTSHDKMFKFDICPFWVHLLLSFLPPSLTLHTHGAHALTMLMCSYTHNAHALTMLTLGVLIPPSLTLHVHDAHALTMLMCSCSHYAHAWSPHNMDWIWCIAGCCSSCVLLGVRVSYFKYAYSDNVDS